MRLQKSTLRTLEPRPTAYDVWDDELKGFVLRIQPTGRMSYFYVYRLNGRRTRHLLGVHPNVSPDGARSLATKAAGEVAGKSDPNVVRKDERREEARRKGSTLGVFLDGKYATWAKANLKSGEFQLARLKADFEDWLDKPMTSITPWLIETYRKKRRDAERSPKTINRELQRLRSAVAKAVAWDVLDEHPFAAVKPLKTDRGGRVRYLSDDEEKRLRAALEKREDELRAARKRFNVWRERRHRPLLPERLGAYVDHLHPLVLVAMNTGLRRGELLSLRWRDVDIAGARLTVQGASAKTGQTRRVPLNAEALETLKAWRKCVESHEPDVYVFPGADGRRLGRVDRAWEAAADAAKLADFRFHDLRHHFASKLVMAGVPLNTVRELLGHTTLEMTLRYAHLAPEALSSAVEKLVQVQR